jgi:hypothetical protein
MFMKSPPAGKGSVMRCGSTRLAGSLAVSGQGGRRLADWAVPGWTRSTSGGRRRPFVRLRRNRGCGRPPSPPTTEIKVGWSMFFVVVEAGLNHLIETKRV